MSKILYEESAVVAVGEIIAIIDLESAANTKVEKKVEPETIKEKIPEKAKTSTEVVVESTTDFSKSDRFYSPLVRTIAKSENIGISELGTIEGTGLSGRVKKQDVLKLYSEQDKQSSASSEAKSTQSAAPRPQIKVTAAEGDTIVQMDRMRKLIAENMVLSKQISPHVTNFIEADVTNLVLWRNKVKDDFETREKQKLTFMPFFIEATAKALKEFPGVNASVDGDKIILRKNINIGVAVALPSGNLIVPVLRNADQKSILV